MPMLKVDTPLSEISGIGPAFLKRLERLGIRTVRDLLFHFPFRYEDFSRVYTIAELEPGQHATIQGTIEDVKDRRSFRRRMTITEAQIADETGTIRAVWFNQPYLKNTIRPGRAANFSGKVSFSEGELYLSQPTHELLQSHETRHTARLVPIYPETRGLTSRGLRFLIQPILAHLEPLAEWIPKEILEAQNFPALTDALRNIHFPDALEDADAARKRFAFEDLFLLQLVNLEQKTSLAHERATPLQTDLEWLKRVLHALPFALTESQKRSLWEIAKDIAKPAPMNRLLQGDVGSGKTVIAALAALIAAKSGFQTAFMAPTEVLARQHFETLQKLFSKISAVAEPPHVGLLTGSGAKILYDASLEAEAKRNAFHEETRGGKIPIVVGTHALISGSGKKPPLIFPKLALVVVDEQHRFGVRQRAALLTNKNVTPHLLSMSATPIPRTVMLTIFGDLDISTITELPTGRKPIITKIVSAEKRAQAYAFIRGQIKMGRQAFVICPRIEPPENTKEIYDSRFTIYDKEFKILELKSVKEEYEKLSTKIFPDLRVAMLHGQMRPKEKETVMRAFSSGGGSSLGGQKHEIDILVCTSVIEVGVDIPNATVMMIEGSDRFGLAQLYQFRGRVGRSAHQSYCLLFTDSDSKTAQTRLKAIVEAKNGFELAEMDLKLRGPGQFLGTEQTGLPDLAMRGLQDTQLIKSSRDAAQAIFARDASLRTYPTLNKKMNEFRASVHFE